MKRRTEPKAVDRAMVKVLAHPLRVQILIFLNDRIASPRQMAEDLDKPLASVIHHAGVLLEHDAIELARTEQRPDGPERFYRTARRQHLTDRDGESFPSGLRSEIAKITLQAHLDDVDDAMVNNTFGGRDDYHLSRMPMVVDQKGWDEVTLLLADTLDRVLQIQADAAARLAGVGDESIYTKISMLHFRSPPGEPR